MTMGPLADFRKRQTQRRKGAYDGHLAHSVRDSGGRCYATPARLEPWPPNSTPPSSVPINLSPGLTMDQRGGLCADEEQVLEDSAGPVSCVCSWPPRSPESRRRLL